MEEAPAQRRRKRKRRKRAPEPRSHLAVLLKFCGPVCIAFALCYTIFSQGSTLFAMFGVVLAFMYARSNLLDERSLFVAAMTCQGGLLIWCIWSVVVERSLILAALSVVSIGALIWLAVRHDLSSVIGLTVLNVVAVLLLVSYIRGYDYRVEDDFHSVVMEFILYGIATGTAWLAWFDGERRFADGQSS